jgi:hypothetical protein
MEELSGTWKTFASVGMTSMVTRSFILMFTYHWPYGKNSSPRMVLAYTHHVMGGCPCWPLARPSSIYSSWELWYRLMICNLN